MVGCSPLCTLHKLCYSTHDKKPVSNQHWLTYHQLVTGWKFPNSDKRVFRCRDKLQIKGKKNWYATCKRNKMKECTQTAIFFNQFFLPIKFGVIIFLAEIIFEICLFHQVQMCFDKLDVNCFLISTFALEIYSYLGPIFKEKISKEIFLTSPASREISIALIQRAWAQASTHIAPDEALNTLMWPVAKPPIMKSL